MIPTKRNDLYIITGASCIGKTSACEILFINEKDYIVMESDLLWSNVYNTPEDNYRTYRELWMRLCSNISQIGLPVVLCGCAIPEQFEVWDVESISQRLFTLPLWLRKMNLLNE